MCQKETAGKDYYKEKISISCVKTLCQPCGNATCQEQMLQKCLSSANYHAI